MFEGILEMRYGRNFCTDGLIEKYIEDLGPSTFAFTDVAKPRTQAVRRLDSSEPAHPPSLHNPQPKLPTSPTLMLHACSRLDEEEYP